MADNTPQHFSEASFWRKVARFALRAGKVVIVRALQVFYASKSAKTPLWAKAIAGTALAYFISPIDAIPDIVPVAGFTDDAAVLATALGSIGAFITTEVKHLAETKLRDWFGADA